MVTLGDKQYGLFLNTCAQCFDIFQLLQRGSSRQLTKFFMQESFTFVLKYKRSVLRFPWKIVNYTCDARKAGEYPPNRK